MTDKQIIIDGVDVHWCEHYTGNIGYLTDKNWTCRAKIQGAKCEDWSNCYFKRWQRKEQECEELKAKFQDMKKSRDIALKEYNEEFEYKRQITVEHLEQKKELLKQLDQLKTENEELKKQNNQFDNGINEQFSKIIELEGRNNFLKQILTEIKEIIEQGVKIHDDIIVSKQILQKISEVENDSKQQ